MYTRSKLRSSGDGSAGAVLALAASAPNVGCCDSDTFGLTMLELLACAGERVGVKMFIDGRGDEGADEAEPKSVDEPWDCGNRPDEDACELPVLTLVRP